MFFDMNYPTREGALDAARAYMREWGFSEHLTTPIVLNFKTYWDWKLRVKAPGATLFFTTEESNGQRRWHDVAIKGGRLSLPERYGSSVSPWDTASLMSTSMRDYISMLVRRAS